MPKNAKRKPLSSRKPLTLQQVRKKAQQSPNDAGAWQMLARSLLRDGELSEAQEAIQRAVELAPQEAEHLEWKGHIEYLRHEVREALQSLEQAQEIKPDSVLGLLTLAKIHSEYGANAKALTYIERAEALASEDIRVLDTKGAILNSLFRLEEAGKVFARLIELDPGSFVHWNNAGNVFRDMGQLDEADRYYQKAIALDSDSPVAYSNRLTALHYDPEATRDTIVEVARQWEKRYAPVGEFTRPLPENREPARRLRIGMVSDGFRKHPVGKMIIRCLEHLEPAQAELFAYSSSDVSDELTQRLKRAFHHWLPIRHLSDEAFAQRIRDDRIDILIDLSGHNSGNRMRVMAMAPAPLLVKWVGGLINTTGMKAIDYLISDAIETPPGEDAYYTEKLIRLPDDYIVFDPPANLPEINELPAKRNGYITLACFNNPTKLNKVTLREWAEVMRQLPDSRLLLKGRPYASEAFCERIYRQMEDGGISRERILIEGPGTNYELLQAYNQADIALDPWPYSGGLTTCEAFIMGLPVVTMTGPTFAGRHSATHLINAGMPELVTHSWEEYRAKIVELASDLDSLATIRQHLREVLLQSPVCDGPRFAHHFTQAMRAIWQRYCEDKAPAALSFDDAGQVWFNGDSAPLEVQYAEQLDDDTGGFSWQLPGKIIAIDNSARLLQQAGLARLRRLKAFGIVAFDPASRVKNPGQYQSSEDVQVFPHAVLGDGQPGTLYACLDPALSGTLEPLPNDQQLDANVQGSQVLTKLPINTVALDSINGLDSLDWLILDDLSDAAAILEHGQKALQNTLLIQVRIAFQPTHQRQPNLAEMQHWMARHGFRFYRFNDERHRSHLPVSVPEAQRQATELVSADALFLPSHERLSVLSEEQCIKLAFLLSTVFGAKDMAYALLARADRKKAEHYLVVGKLIDDPRNMVAEIHNVKEAMFYLESCRLEKKIPNHKLPQKLVVSLTSYEARFATLHLTIKSLLCQSVVPDEVVLWIAEEEKGLLPEKVTQLETFGLRVAYCKDIRSYKKIVPTLEEYAGWFVVTADDDLFYGHGWLEGLVTAWSGSYDDIVAHRAHKIELNKKGIPQEYVKWKWQVGVCEIPDGYIFPTCGAGTLFPPGAFHEDVTKKEKFIALCPDADDVWLYWMFSINGKKARVSGYNFEMIEWPNAEATPLWHKNLKEGGNDEKIRKMIEEYGAAWKFPFKKGDDSFSFTYREKKVNFYLPDRDDHIQKAIRSRKEFYEIEMLSDIDGRVCKGATIFDIGANIGNHTVFFGMFCDAGKVFSFEPHPKTCALLKDNILLNGLSHVVSCFQIGVGELPGKANISFYDDKNIGMARLEVSGEGEIDVVRLDDVAAEHGVKVSLLKIDVEGMELSVLKGASRILENDSPCVYAEAGTDDEFFSIKKYLAKYGYSPVKRFNATPTYLFLKV
ncbi:FkbM family methyltransferase [Marinobacter sp. TBZ242]|uniref:protein O-GlcNAc transferase n=1 Tax=Marinobacter azerbaijanicus TaxID=3050455 RepID=A0ABT7IIL4_9GAMM|nr:FkbM family methyltransferase [Marinobacter sp. TBZ242]MDL0434021.1 FkbM family methyltransferase [Marinobacter sp. TBZ242]